MRNRIVKTGIVLFVIVSFCGCETIKETANMLLCTFERKNIDNFRFAGVDFDRIAEGKLSPTETIAVTAALLKGTAPVSFNMNVEGTNPTNTNAALEQFKWIFLLKGEEVLNGNITNKFSIPSQGTNILPIEMSFDAWKYLDGSSIESLITFYQDLTGKNSLQQSNSSLKIRPTINGLEFPNYITLN